MVWLGYLCSHCAYAAYAARGNGSYRLFVFEKRTIFFINKYVFIIGAGQNCGCGNAFCQLGGHIFHRMHSNIYAFVKQCGIQCFGKNTLYANFVQWRNEVYIAFAFYEQQFGRNAVFANSVCTNVACQTANWLSRVPIMSVVFITSPLIGTVYVIVDGFDVIAAGLIDATHFYCHGVDHFLYGISVDRWSLFWLLPVQESMMYSRACRSAFALRLLTGAHAGG